MRRLAAVAALFAMLCSGSQAAVDDRGTAIAVQAPQRVVALYGSFAEAWLLAGGTLVGASEDAVEERALDLGEDVAIVGTTKHPNLEIILQLEPDLVLLSMDIAGQAQAAEVLEAAGVACAAFRVDSYVDYARMMEVFAELTGRSDLYRAQIPPLVAQIESIIEAARAEEAPTVLLLRAYSSGVKAKAADNLAGAILEDLGCVNIAGEAMLEEVTLEAIVAADPQYIFVTTMGADEDAALATLEATLGANPAWQALTAVREGRVYLLPKDLFHYKPNQRWGESYAYLYDILYP